MIRSDRYAGASWCRQRYGVETKPERMEMDANCSTVEASGDNEGAAQRKTRNSG